MTVSVQCAKCQHQYNVRDEMVGKRVKCKQCGEPMLVAPAPKPKAQSNTPPVRKPAPKTPQPKPSPGSSPEMPKIETGPQIDTGGEKSAPAINTNPTESSIRSRKNSAMWIWLGVGAAAIATTVLIVVFGMGGDDPKDKEGLAQKPGAKSRPLNPPPKDPDNGKTPGEAAPPKVSGNNGGNTPGTNPPDNPPVTPPVTPPNTPEQKSPEDKPAAVTWTATADPLPRSVTEVSAASGREIPLDGVTKLPRVKLNRDNGHFAAVSGYEDANRIRRLDLRSGKWVGEINESPPPQLYAISRDGQWMLGIIVQKTGQPAELAAISSGEMPKILEYGKLQRMFLLDFVGPDSFVTAEQIGKTGRARIWSLSSGQMLREFDLALWNRPKTISTGFRKAAVSPGQQFLAYAGSDRFVRIYDIKSGRRVGDVEFTYDPGRYINVQDLSFSPDGRWLTLLFHFEVTHGSNKEETRLVCIDMTTGQQQFDQTLGKLASTLRAGTPMLQWLPDSTGVVLGGKYLVDLQQRKVVWEGKRTGPQPLRVLDRKRMLHLSVKLAPGSNQRVSSLVILPTPWSPDALASSNPGTGTPPTTPGNPPNTPVNPVSPGTVRNPKGAVDLLKLVDATRDFVRGRAQITGGKLLFGGGSPDVVHIRYTPPQAYTLMATVTPKQGAEALALGLVVGGRQCQVLIDGFASHGFYSGLERIKGQRVERRENATRVSGRQLKNDVASQIICTVRRNKVTVTCDGRQIVQWQGDPNLLSPESQFGVPDSKSLMLGAWNCQYEISRLQLIPGGSAKVPEPSQDVVRQVDQRLKELFDYDAAKTPQAKHNLAKQLMQRGLETKDDPSTRFALFRKARDLFAVVGDFGNALQTVDELALSFDIDSLAWKADTLKAVRLPVRAVQQHAALSRSAAELCESAASAEAFDSALALSTVALASAKKGSLSQEDLHARRKQIQQDQELFRAVKPFLQTLETTPNDAQANLMVGRYRCLGRNEWEQGIPLLLKSNDSVFKPLAQQEQTNPSEWKQQIPVGDAWLAAGKSATGELRTWKPQMLARAVHWYSLALASATGVEKVALGKKLAEVAKLRPKSSIYLASIRASDARYHQMERRDLGQPRKNFEGQAAVDTIVRTVAFKGQVHRRSFWMHPPDRQDAYVVFDLNGQFNEISGAAAMADTIKRATSATPMVFVLKADGAEIWRSRPLRRLGEAHPFKVKLNGALRLELIVLCEGKTNRYGHAVWLDPKVSR